MALSNLTRPSAAFTPLPNGALHDTENTYGICVIADDDLVAVHARYEDVGTTPVTGFDVFCIENRKFARHRDVIAPMPGPDAARNEAGQNLIEPGSAFRPGAPNRSKQ